MYDLTIVDTIGCEAVYQLVKDKDVNDRHRIEIEQDLKSCPYCQPERLNPEGILRDACDSLNSTDKERSREGFEEVPPPSNDGQ